MDLTSGTSSASLLRRKNATDEDSNRTQSLERDDEGEESEGRKRQPLRPFEYVDNNNGKNREAGFNDTVPPAPKTFIPTKRNIGRSWYEQWRAFSSMSSPYFRESRRGRCHFYILIMLTFASSGVRVVFSYINRDFWSALSDQRVDDFYAVMRKFVLALLVLAPISVFYRYQRQKLAIDWRDWMTARVLGLYFGNRVYYALERQIVSSAVDGDGAANSEREVDNPDQRIAEDIRSYTEFSLYFFLSIVTSVIDLVFFSFVLFSIMPRLFLAVAVFAISGTVGTILIGKVLIRLEYEALRREADFRFSLVRVRENAESIAFYAGEAVEERETDRRLENVIDNMRKINSAQRNLEFLSQLYSYLTWVIPLIVVAPEYFAGRVEMGVVSQASAAFYHVLTDLSLVVNSFTDFSKFSAGIDRIFSFLSAIRDLNPDTRVEGFRSSEGVAALLLTKEARGRRGVGVANEEKPSWHVLDVVSDDTHRGDANDTIRIKEIDEHGPEESSVSTSTSSQPMPSLQGTNPSAALLIHNLHVTTPDRKRSLVQNLNLSLPQGVNLLITGPSGCGKSSLLRAIAGLWTAGSGTVRRPLKNKNDTYFLPQRPYCPPGTLRDQLLYPSGSGEESTEKKEEFRTRMDPSPSDDDLLAILQLVDLPHLASRSGGGDSAAGLRVELDWGNTLSLGEQQRLAFGRLLVNRPKLVIMDESTSALDVAAERRMYGLLKNLPGTSAWNSSPGMAGSGGGAATLPSLTYVSVGHRPTLLAYHDLKLSLAEGITEVIPANSNSIDEGFILS